VICRPALHAGEAKAVKSPDIMAGVRTNATMVYRPSGSSCLDIPEKEELVPNDRTAQRSAELVTLQRVALQSKKVSSVESVIADELKHVAVELVRAGFRNCVNLAN
jgi:hypothetical protein